jgi:hypothetical protein
LHRKGAKAAKNSVLFLTFNPCSSQRTLRLERSGRLM